jgi:EAL domain-containing protein (putative c-di-GMP-specific phosphodiesterase class I)/GGDEF domain-containing protein
MSLYKQLWLAVIFLLTLVFVGSVIVSSLSAKTYLQQQLSMKNSDNATALALSLTQQDADEVLLELTLSAQFDTGFYELIQLTDPEGVVTILREDTQDTGDAPDWFMKLFPIEVEPGIASVMKGWQQVGLLTLRSHSRFAYAELWHSTQKMAIVFLLVMILAGALGSYLLKIILRPLENVVDQAKAIGERRFISIPEPKTLEFRQVVKSMNNLSERIRQMLAQEAKRLEKLQREAHVDKVSGLMNREPFMRSLDAALHSDDVNSAGSICLVRLTGLMGLNEKYGHTFVDSMIADMGAGLNSIVTDHSRSAACRLNGSDFALLVPRAIQADQAAKKIQQALRAVLEDRSIDDDVPLPAAASLYQQGDTIGEIMTRLDSSMLISANEGISRINVAAKGDIHLTSVREQMVHWRDIFDHAFSEGLFSLATFPAIGTDGGLLHIEAPVRLAWEGELITAGQFLPWVNRLEMSRMLDQQVVQLALQKIEETGQPVSVNLSVAAVVEPSFAEWISEQLSVHADAAEKLWMELAEPMAFRHLSGFKLLCSRVKEYGAKIGIEHMGHQLAALGELHDVGLDYLKVDANFVRDINENTANQNLLGNLCTVGHSIGVIVIAEGVRSDEEWETLKEIGFDGATGPGIV